MFLLFSSVNHWLQRNGVPVNASGKEVRTWIPPVPTSVWIKYANAVFEVTPVKNNVDSLKDAVKAKWEANVDTKLNAMKLTVKDYSGTVLRASAPLQGNTYDTAYMVE